MRSFPLPVRVAAGLAATTVEQSRQLPSYLLGLPVTLASQALQVSMRLQQQVTELAIKGDEALADCRSTEQQPEWATFDEDEPAWKPHVVPPPVDDSPVVDEDPTAVDEDSTAVADDTTVLADYDQLSLPQLRGKLRMLTESDIAQLLTYEREHGNRSDFLRMLSNRLDRVRSQQ